MFSRCTFICVELWVHNLCFMIFDGKCTYQYQFSSVFILLCTLVNRTNILLPIHINVCVCVIRHFASTFNWALRKSKWINADDLISVLSLPIVSLWNLRYHSKSVCVCVVFVCASFISSKGKRKREKTDKWSKWRESKWQLNQNGIFNSSMAMLSLVPPLANLFEMWNNERTNVSPFKARRHKRKIYHW